MSKSEFTTLDDDSKERLETDSSSRVAYIDLLSYLHDLLATIGNDPQPRRLPLDVIHRELAELAHVFSSGSQIGEAARANIAAAELLHSALGRNFSVGEEKKLTGLRVSVDVFLEDLVYEYNLIRNIRAAEGVRR